MKLRLAVAAGILATTVLGRGSHGSQQETDVHPLVSNHHGTYSTEVNARMPSFAAEQHRDDFLDFLFDFWCFPDGVPCLFGSFWCCGGECKGFGCYTPDSPTPSPTSSPSESPRPSEVPSMAPSTPPTPDPTILRDLLEEMRGKPELSTFVGLIETLGLEARLESQVAGTTVLAPPNSVLDPFVADLTSTLGSPGSSDVVDAAFRRVIRYHFVTRIYDEATLNSLSEGVQLPTAAGNQDITIDFSFDDVLLLEDSQESRTTITTPDCPAENGIIHIINGVLRPQCMTCDQCLLGTNVEYVKKDDFGSDVNFASAVDNTPVDRECVLTPIATSEELADAAAAATTDECWVGITKEESLLGDGNVNNWKNLFDDSDVPAESDFWNGSEPNNTPSPQTRATINRDENDRLRDVREADQFGCAIYKCCTGTTP